jgi:hypothetical protein
MNWNEIDWEALERLRGLFLAGGAARRPYWASSEDLAAYDLTFGERIGWKWDAVLAELDRRGWRPPASAPRDRPSDGGPPPAKKWSVLDWGCGSGVAGRRVVNWLGADRVSVLRLWDHSALAVTFATQVARDRFPGLRVESLPPRPPTEHERPGILVVSHVLNELPPEARRSLGDLAGSAEAVLWVEPGTAEVSRDLIGIREQFRDRFRAVAPCTHPAACGLLTPANARHWCHHFAAPPPAIFVDSNWMKFGRRAGIDLRSLPYSFLVLERTDGRPAPRESGESERVIGEPRVYKALAKVLSCGPAGVRDLILQKRDAPELFKQFKHPRGPQLYRWTRAGDRILAGVLSAAPREPPAGLNAD